MRQSLYINLKSDYTDLKIKLHEQTTKHSELGMELKAEEEANQVFRTEDVLFMQELEDRVCQQEEASSPVSQNPELVEEESLCVLQDSEPMAVVFLCAVHDPELLEGTLCAAHNPEHTEQKRIDFFSSHIREIYLWQ